MKSLTNEAANLIKGNQRVLGRLMALYNKSYFTIIRWIEEKDIRITAPTVLQIINEETGLTDDRILEETVAA